jgi:hypothetical protein
MRFDSMSSRVYREIAEHGFYRAAAALQPPKEEPGICEQRKTPVLISRLRRTLSQRLPNGIESRRTADNFAPRSVFWRLRIDPGGRLSPRPDPENDASRLTRVALLAALAWVTASFLVQELYSLDAWWHIAIGRDILDHWSIPRLDRYTVAGLGLPYHDSHWLFQLLLGVFHRAFGLVGVQLVQIGLWSGALALTYRAARRWAETGTSAALVFLAAMACVERFLPRPEAVSVLMVAAFYLVLADQGRSLRARLATLVVLQVIWVNSHGLFIIGPGMVGAYAVEAAWIRWRTKSGEWKPALATLGAVLLATLATPYGVSA